MNLFSLFERALDTHASGARQIALAYSGGVDSRVMLELLATYRDIHPQHDYLVIHVHHGLSPFADSWLAECERTATELGFAFCAKHVRLNPQGQSLESAAREARYQAMLGCLEQDALLLSGQHADDQAETFLLALKRGSGIAGLAAMPRIRPLEHVQLLRPLLDATRAEIEAYAEQQGLTWINDESNQDCRFDRNFIRNRWLPEASERWAGIVKAINRSAAHCAEQQLLMDELLAGDDNKVQRSDGSLACEVLLTYSPLMQSALLRRWLKKQGNIAPSQVQLQQIFHSMIAADQDANPIMQLGDNSLRRFQHHLYLLPPFRDVSMWTQTLNFSEPLPLPNGIGTLEFTDFTGKAGLGLTCPVPEDDVRVSFDPQGLSAHPLGRQGSRKLKKLFQEYGVPSWQRRRTPLIFYGDQLAAVADLFVCQGFEGSDCELIWHR